MSTNLFVCKQVKPISFRPFVSKVSHLIPTTTYEKRKTALERAGYNLFNLPSTMISGGDYLTDSGTGGLFDTQRSMMELHDESYAGSTSYQRFEDSFKAITGMPNILPVHQGRAAEKVLFSSLLNENCVVLSNSLFDTTRAHVENTKAKGLDLVIDECYNIESSHPFKGNIDLNKVKKAIEDANTNGKKIPFCVMTLTNNTGGGQPASMQNIRELKSLLDQYKIPLMIDACRFAENCYFIKQREPGYGNKSIEEIAKELFSYAECFTMSAKKDGIAHMGGAIGFRNPEWMDLLKPAVILNEGFINYGGMSGRDMEAVAQGLKEVLNEDYLRTRIEDTAYFADQCKKYNIPIITPPGGHAIYVDAGKLLPHLKSEEFPGQALACELYLRSGIRSCEMGSIMFGSFDEQGNLVKPHKRELVRFAIPRLVYNREHLKYAAQQLALLKQDAFRVKGMKFVSHPKVLPHFSATFNFVN